MSNRFCVNGVQIFGNNELFENTKKELDKQGAVWLEDGWVMKRLKITDPDGLMEAVTKDSLNELKRVMLNHYDFKTGKDIKKTFDELTDADAINVEHKDLLNSLYDHEGNPQQFAFKYLQYWIEDRRAMTPYVLWLAISDKVQMVGGKLVLKKNKNIWATMH